MSIISPSRCVLLLSDEGLHIYDAVAGRVRFVDAVPWNTQDLEDSVAEIIRRRCRGKSVVVLNDMVEQHYRKERIPKVSPFDRVNVVRRRVAVALPSYPIRAALKLKEKASPRERESASTAGDIYLFAATPLSDQVRKALASVQRSFASMAGFCLLPVESSSMVHALSKKLSRLTDKPPVWTIFVGQHQSGGLRQIVTRNGELALTRMTPISDSDIDHDIWSSDVASEIKGTMSYLSRFGFDPSDGLDVVVIANNSVADRVVAKVDFDCNLNVMTSAEVANLLGLKIGQQEDQRYADPLHVAWIARRSSLVMPLSAPQIAQISSPAKYATAASLLLLAACGYFGYQAYLKGTAWLDNKQKIETAQQRLAVVKQEHSEEVQKKAAAGVDFLLIENSTKVFTGLEKLAMKPLSVFDAIGKALGPDLHLQSMSVNPLNSDTEFSLASAPPSPDGTPAPEATQREFDVVIRIVFPAKLAPEVGVRKIAELESRLKANLPKHRVSIVKQVADLSYTGNFVGEAGKQVNATGDNQDYEAQILIRGALI